MLTTTVTGLGVELKNSYIQESVPTKNLSVTERNKVVKKHLGLVHGTAKLFFWSGIPEEDLAQEGVCGLIEAVERFDATRNVPFSSYAMFWIRRSIEQLLEQYRGAFRTPARVTNLQYRIEKARKRLTKKNGTAPTLAEVALHVRVPESQLRIALLCSTSSDSLDEDLVSKLPGFTLKDTICDARVFSIETYIEAKEELEAARGRVSRLLHDIRMDTKTSERDVEIFSTFYGLNSDRKRKTYRETGVHFGLTTERTRQIILRIWRATSARGSTMNHLRFLEEQSRIEALEELLDSANP